MTRSETPARPRLRRLAIRAVIALVAVLVLAIGLAAIEVGSWGLLRLRGNTAESFGARYRRGPETSQYLPFVGYRYAPNAKDVLPGLDTDRHGFIHNGDSTRDLSTKEPGVFRIFIVGSSIVGGYHAPRGAIAGETIPAQIERLLNAQSANGWRFEVVNAGVQAWTASQELAMLTFYVSDFQPDLVVVFNGFPDVYHAIRAPREGSHPHINPQLINQARAAFVHERSITGTLRQALGLLGARFYAEDVLRRVRTRVGAMRGDQAGLDKPVAPLPPDPLLHYRRNLRMMFGVARSLGVPIAAVLQPTMLASNSEGRATREPLLRETASSWPRIDFWGEKDALYSEARAIYAELQREFDDGRSVIVRDLSTVLDEAPDPLYIDQSHFTTPANSIIAEALARELSAWTAAMPARVSADSFPPAASVGPAASQLLAADAQLLLPRHRPTGRRH